MKRLLCVIMSVILLLMCTACGVEENPSTAIELNPTEEASNVKDVGVMLYFANADYTMLAGEERTVSVPVSRRLEYSVLEELIAGPGENGISFNQLINPKTKIVSMFESNGVLSVTLSNSFLDWSFITYPDISGSLNAVKRLTLYSLVNTLIEISGYSRIQFFVDREGNGTSQRINLSEVGMSESGVLETLGWDGSIILSASNTLQAVLATLQAKNYTKLYSYIARVDEFGNSRMDETSFINWMMTKGVSVENFTIAEVVENVGNNQKVLIINYATNSESAERQFYNNIAVKLVKENSMWKITFPVLESLLK